MSMSSLSHTDARQEPALEVSDLPTPIGLMTVAVRDGRLVSAAFADRWPAKSAHRLSVLASQEGALRPSARQAADPDGVVSRLSAYFAGDLEAIDGIDVDVDGTPFQEAVWRVLREIPCGETVSYREVAELVGRPAAVRAVGNAVGANHVGVVVPCHRVVASSGGLGGYGGGLDRKRWLLTHEGALI
jgi:methylated-DNA-[protein]-cysteine S-methyltransferase